MPVAGGKADAQAGQIRALRQRVEDDHVVKVWARRFQHAARGVRAVDFAITLVGKDEETETLRQRRQPCEVSAIGDRALRVRGRCEVKRDGAREQYFVDRVEIGQEAGFARRRQIDRLATGRERASSISGIERIGDQHCRIAGARRNPAARGDGGEEKAFTGAIEHQHLVFRIDGAGQGVAPA